MVLPVSAYRPFGDTFIPIFLLNQVNFLRRLNLCRFENLGEIHLTSHPI